MSLSAFVPKSTLVYTGLRLPQDVHRVNALDIQALCGDAWTLEIPVRSEKASTPGEAFIEIDQPWGKSRAFGGDYILRGPKGISVVNPGAFHGMKLTEIRA